MEDSKPTFIRDQYNRVWFSGGCLSGSAYTALAGDDGIPLEDLPSFICDEDSAMRIYERCLPCG